MKLLNQDHNFCRGHMVSWQAVEEGDVYSKSLSDYLKRKGEKM